MPDKNSMLGGFISVGLHLAVLAFLLLTLPIPASNNVPDNVPVELVEPPAPPAPASVEQIIEESAEASQAPQAFESASNTDEEKTEVEALTPVETPQPEASETAEDNVPQQEEQAQVSEPVLSTEKSDTSVGNQEKPAKAMKKAKKIYSEGALSDPRVKQALGQLSSTERVSQICGIEALEQIRHNRPNTPPDMMARKGGVLTETSLKMSGGAFRSHSKWYELDFNCEIDAAEMKVSSFRYSIGDAIAAAELKSRGLPLD
ncbi:DUF930 domain-containing protein [Paenochrobactrum glaciei]|uniref:DUF930 domain-containing protein n=1 Tax=Paenochrobactrum glaciei TaxID=486407 RepID=A0ABN1GH87_9HYPH